ncbi:MAG: hypothetical protein HFG62_18005 [Lachnospiraceae bacterium]|nr:hypothetical protein [Lachnospiraceae bacterium]
MIKEILEQYRIPRILTMNSGEPCTTKEMWETRRKEILELFSSQVYGYMPPAPEQVTFAVKGSWDNQIQGKATIRQVEVSFSTPSGPFSFPFHYYEPVTGHPVPAIVFLQFGDHPVYCSFPVEKIMDNGFAVAVLNYETIQKDRYDFAQGLAGMYITGRSQWDGLCADTYAKNRKRGETQWGFIGAWAFAASRIMDYLQTLEQVDRGRIAVMGHSRLGKTALWCAANDPRFCLAAISASGCSGASLSKMKDETCEKIGQITEVFPYWFSRRWPSYAGREKDMPFDQHWLLASLAPRSFYLCSGSEDAWAGPRTEYLCAAAANEVYHMLGLEGLKHPDRMPVAGDIFDEGTAGYSMHDGTHFLGDFEWENVMKFMKKSG